MNESKISLSEEGFSLIENILHNKEILSISEKKYFSK
jgi:hypothetical protein